MARTSPKTPFMSKRDLGRSKRDARLRKGEGSVEDILDLERDLQRMRELDRHPGGNPFRRIPKHK